MLKPFRIRTINTQKQEKGEKAIIKISPLSFVKISNEFVLNVKYSANCPTFLDIYILVKTKIIKKMLY